MSAKLPQTPRRAVAHVALPPILLFVQLAREVDLDTEKRRDTPVFGEQKGALDGSNPRYPR